jgi:hypothetical protein
MASGFLSGLRGILDIGGAYLQHVNLARRALDGAPDEAPALLSAYARGLSEASFAGFKVTLAMLIAKEGDPARRAALQQLLHWSDPARRGESIAAPPPTAAARVDKDDFDQDLALVSGWYEKLNEEQRQQALVKHIQSLTPTGYRRLTAHLRQMQTNIAERIRQHEANEANEANAWGRFAEDRMAYQMARLRTGQRDPNFMRQLGEYRDFQTFIDWLLEANELLWRNREESEMAQEQKQDVAKIRDAVREFTVTGKYPGGADQMQQDVAALVLSGEADEVMAILESAGANQGGNKTLNISDYYRPGEGKYELRWPVGFPLPLPFEQLDRPTQFSVLFGEWTRREMEASYALGQGETAKARDGFEESLARAEQIEVPELVARSHEGLARVASKTNQRSLERQHLKLAIAARAST